MTVTPTSGDILRAFSRTSMTAAARHVAEVLAAAISYDGKHRGAPVGASAFTITELRQATGLSERSINNALRELTGLFGLIVHRRHHQRHLFRLTRITDEDSNRNSAETAVDASNRQGVTGKNLRVPLYSKTRRDNCSHQVRIDAEPNVHKTNWAAWIDRFKRGTPAAEVDTQFLWNGFCGLNRRNGHAAVPISFLMGFLRKYPTKKVAEKLPLASSSPPPRTVTPSCAALIELARPAPFANRHWHKSALITAIGRQAYDNRVRAIMDRYGCGPFSAEGAVHGQAVRSHEIQP